MAPDVATITEHEKLIELISKTLAQSDKLSQNENDYYARCSAYLYEALQAARRMQ